MYQECPRISYPYSKVILIPNKSKCLSIGQTTSFILGLFSIFEYFQNGNFVEKFAHVLVNTLVVVPFIPWHSDFPNSDANPKCERTFSMPNQPIFYDTDSEEDRNSHTPVKVTKSMGVLKSKRGNQADGDKETNENLIPRGTSSNKGLPKSKSEANIQFPNVSAPLVYEVGDIPERIVNFWWEEPGRKITEDDVKKNILEKGFLKHHVPAEIVHGSFKDLEKNGFINKTLFNPQKTWREYFWLLLFQVSFNAIALGIEIGNGGAYTKSGVYVSWDVRLGAFFLGLIFLMMYYKKYHVLKELVGNKGCCAQAEYWQVVCCFKTQTPLKAIPVEEDLRKYMSGEILEVLEEERKEDDADHGSPKVDMMTQTSLIETPKMKRENNDIELNVIAERKGEKEKSEDETKHVSI